MVVPPNASEGASSVWWRLGVKGLPRLRFRDKGRRLEGALGGGAKVKELRVVRTPLRTGIHVVVRHPEGEMPQVEPSNPVGIRCGSHAAPDALGRLGGTSPEGGRLLYQESPTEVLQGQEGLS